MGDMMDKIFTGVFYGFGAYCGVASAIALDNRWMPYIAQIIKNLF
ncbi:hypothetical protein uan_087 [Pseudomonas phage UAntarctica]|nr:hypothetical protein uan_087 [Pseudomonas phage UAntarctica]